MFRALTSSNRAVAQRVVRSTLSLTRAASSTDSEAGSISSGGDAFGKKEKAEETRWARRFEAEQAQKYQNQRNKSAQGGGGQQTGGSQAYGQQKSDRQASGDLNQQQSDRQGSGGSNQQRLAALEAEKRRIDQEIAELKRQQR